MENMPNHYRLNLDAASCPEAIVYGDCFRFTVLTERLLRMEYDADGAFEDRPTQTVWNRRFEPAAFRLTEDNDGLKIRTDYFELTYRKGPFTKSSLSIDVLGGYSCHENTWHFGDPSNTLKGTCRTLDKADGAVPLEEGVCSRIGYSILDDSQSLLLTEDGWIQPRKKGTVDIYYFAYGHDYRACIRDFYRLTGAPPLLPRYALGNWWSRYHAYTQQEYTELMERFREEDIPFSVAVLDMDWHITEVPERYGRGWTGYTWNEALFPDHKGFLEWLHDHHMKVSLNLHPADGVKGFEKIYAPMGKVLGVDVEKEDPIPFDVSSKAFMNAYFTYLHHPLEEEGVDFWWIDWQSGGVSPVEGLDPLWMLNHYHALDIARNGKRPLIFSRYSGPGSHRYPVGFSGDTCITWDSLRFQPYFTATASNIGYPWWSHDIGGHMKGVKDDELMTRWLQFGVFSPINRLHSSNSPFSGKEPWKYGMEAEKVMKYFLRLRQQLVPYLYSMNYRCAEKLEPLIQPMYYSHPESPQAYEHPNEYWFGSEMIVCPITERTSFASGRASVDVWLPKGKWTDLFTGTVYSGEKRIRMYRTLDSIPVLAKAGAIVPTAGHVPHDNGLANPEALTVYVFSGASNSFTLYEDEGDNNRYREGVYAITEMNLDWSDSAVSFTVCPGGDLSVLPAQRAYTLCLRGFHNAEVSASDSHGIDIPIQKNYDTQTHSLMVVLPRLETSAGFTVTVRSNKSLINGNDDYKNRILSMLHEMQTSFELKDRIAKMLEHADDRFTIVSTLHSMDMTADILGALLETVTS